MKPNHSFYLQEQSGDKEALALYLYWLTNTHELLSLVCTTGPFKSSTHQQGVDRLVTKAKHELQQLEVNLFGQVMKETHVKLNKMVVPAVIESQSLPGFLATDAGRMFSSQAAYTMEDLIRYLDHVMGLLGQYHLEVSTQEQVVNEVMKYIGVSCFNDIMGRRNYNSWKRGKEGSLFKVAQLHTHHLHIGFHYPISYANTIQPGTIGGLVQGTSHGGRHLGIGTPDANHQANSIEEEHHG